MLIGSRAGFGDNRLEHVLIEAQHREHPARPEGTVLFHQASAFADKHQGILEVDDVGCHQRGELAEAMPRDILRRNHLPHGLPALAQHIETGDAHGKDGRLGVDRVVEILFRSFEAHARQREAEDLVGALKDLTRGLGDVEERFAHPDVLRTLPREDKGHRTSPVGDRHREIGRQATDTFPLT